MTRCGCIPVSPLDETACVGDAIELQSEDEGEEARPVKVLKSPTLPTTVEVDERSITHLPFRNSCPFCVQGKAENFSHETQGEKEYQIPHIVCDYCVLGGDDDEDTLNVQVAKDMQSQCLFAHAVPRKGLAHIHGPA